MENIVLRNLFPENFRVQEAYKALRTNLLLCGQDLKVIALTSVDENEGKTSVSLGLARSLAELGKRVLVIDADMRKSVFASRYAKVKHLRGLSEVLTGMSSFSEVICVTQHENLHILSAGKYPPNPVELLNSRYFKLLVENARKYYDYVLVDTPPLGRVIDAAVVASVCDGVVMVMGDKVRSGQAKKVVAQLEKTGCRILGAVRNFVTQGNTLMYKRY